MSMSHDPEVPAGFQDADIEMREWEQAAELMEVCSICPACGEVIDYCQGHGQIGDPEGFNVIEHHDAGLHNLCHANAKANGMCD